MHVEESRDLFECRPHFTELAEHLPARKLEFIIIHIHHRIIERDFAWLATTAPFLGDCPLFWDCPPFKAWRSIRFFRLRWWSRRSIQSIAAPSINLQQFLIGCWCLPALEAGVHSELPSHTSSKDVWLAWIIAAR